MAAGMKDFSPDVTKILVAALMANGFFGHINKLNPYLLVRLLAVATHLKDVTPDLLKVVPEIAAQLADKPIDGTDQAYLWYAAAEFRDLVPDLVKMLPERVGENFNQKYPAWERFLALSIELEAISKLKDVAPQTLKILPEMVALVISRV